MKSRRLRGQFGRASIPICAPHCSTSCQRHGQFGALRRGAAVVEFALVIPFLMTLTLGLCELGQAYKIQAILSAASRAGCATGMRPGSSSHDVIADVKAVLTANGLPSTLATVTIRVNDVSADAASAGRNDKLTVQVSVLASQVLIINSLTYFNGSSTLSQTTTMLKQG